MYVKFLAKLNQTLNILEVSNASISATKRFNNGREKTENDGHPLQELEKI